MCRTAGQRHILVQVCLTGLTAPTRILLLLIGMLEVRVLSREPVEPQVRRHI